MFHSSGYKPKNIRFTINYPPIRCPKLIFNMIILIYIRMYLKTNSN